MEASTAPPEFDPWAQDFNISGPHGTNIMVNMGTLNAYRLYGARSTINYGTQVGASLVLLVVLLLLTGSKKRKSPIFLINAFSLLANTIRCLLYCCYFTGDFWDFYTQLTNDWSRVSTSDVTISVAASFLTLLVTIMVIASLSLQVWVACVTTEPLQRYITMTLTSIVGCVALGYKTTVIVYNIKQTINFESLEPYQGLAATASIMQAVAIWVYSCVFTYKLGYAIIRRRRLNMPQFGPMQIVFIMGCQTMLVPALFSALQFYKGVPEFGTQVLTVVCIFSPLSAIWAGVANESSVAARGPNSRHRLVHGDYNGSTSNNTSTSSTVYDKSRQMSVCTSSKERDFGNTINPLVSGEKTMGEDNSVHVDYAITLRNELAADRV